jgi:hypothetical protein
VNPRGRHVGFLTSLYLVVILYPIVEEWRQRRDKKHLADMRNQSARNAARGKWIDN